MIKFELRIDNINNIVLKLLIRELVKIDYFFKRVG